MKTIKLHDDIFTELHIVKKSEWDKMIYTDKSIRDKKIKTAFLPGYGTTLFFEYKHFLIVPDNAKTKPFAIWRNHKVIGYCNITQAIADKANKNNDMSFYFGYDEITNPEKYKDIKN